MSDKSAADNMPLDEATEFLVRGHRKYFNQNPSKESLIRHIKRLDRELKQTQKRYSEVKKFADDLADGITADLNATTRKEQRIADGKLFDAHEDYLIWREDNE